MQSSKLVWQTRPMLFLWRSVGERVVGYLHLEEYDVLYAGHMVNVLGIAVSSACRRQGVGRALLAAGEVWARSQGAEAVRLVSGESRRAPTPFTQAWVYGQQAPAELQKEPHPRGAVTASLFSLETTGNPGDFMKRMLKIKNFKKAIDFY